MENFRYADIRQDKPKKGGSSLDALRQLIIIAGHSGSGKTEFAVNLALALARQEPVTLVDLDIINPYFCSRERQALLEEAGIELISPASSSRMADLPALPAEVARIFTAKRRAILDLGGDRDGARILGRYRPQLDAASPDLWLVLNANRPRTAQVCDALALLREIEAACQRRCTGIVNNTHLCERTRPEDLLAGAALAEAVGQAAGVPVICHVATAGILSQIPPQVLAGTRFPIEIRMKKPWE